VVDLLLRRLGDRILGPAPVGLLTANQVDGAVVDHAHEAGLHRASLGVVALWVPPDRHERFLHDLLREMRLPYDPLREGLGRGRVPREQAAERVLVAITEAEQQVAIARLGDIDHPHRLAPDQQRRPLFPPRPFGVRPGCGRSVAGYSQRIRPWMTPPGVDRRVGGRPSGGSATGWRDPPGGTGRCRPTARANAGTAGPRRAPRSPPPGGTTRASPRPPRRP